MSSAQEAPRSRGGSGQFVYKLHDEGDSEDALRVVPLPVGASTVVVTATGSAPALAPQVAFAQEGPWFSLTGSDLRTRAAVDNITVAGAYTFDTTGWLFFSLDVGTGCVCTARATVTAAPAPSAGVVSASGARADLQVVLDEVSDTLLYVGQAVAGVETPAAAWRIRRVSTVGVVTTVAYADGDANFDNVWDNRASLSYS